MGRVQNMKTAPTGLCVIDSSIPSACCFCSCPVHMRWKSPWAGFRCLSLRGAAAKRQKGGGGQEPARPPQSPAFAPEEFRPSGFSERHCEDQSGKARRQQCRGPKTKASGRPFRFRSSGKAQRTSALLLVQLLPVTESLPPAANPLEAFGLRFAAVFFRAIRPFRGPFRGTTSQLDRSDFQSIMGSYEGASSAEPAAGDHPRGGWGGQGSRWLGPRPTRSCQTWLCSGK
jgi:hypothetical protein